MKKFLLLAALACGSLSAMAQKLYVAPYTIGVGETKKEIAVSFEHEGVIFSACQFDVYCSGGITLSGINLKGGNTVKFDMGGTYLDDFENEADDDHTYAFSKQSDGAYRVVIYSPNNCNFAQKLDGTITKDKGTMCMLMVNAKSPYTEGKIELKNIIFASSGSSSGTDKNGAHLDDTAVSSIPAKITTLAEGSTEWHVSTIASPFDIDLPEGVTASKGSKRTGYVLLDENESTKVDAGIPAFLLSKKAVELYCFGVPTKTSCSGDLLEGVYEPTPITGGLVLNGGTLKKVTSTTLPAYKAYIPADKAAEVKGVMIGDVVTGLDAISSEEVKTIYSVSGMQLNKAQKGLNIVNGKKFLVK